MQTRLQDLFYEIAQKYSQNTSLIDRLWDGITTAYESPRRHYHNFDHLRQLLQELQEVKDTFENWNATVFALFYHDLVYRPFRLRDERKSAKRAKNDLSLLVVDPNTIQATIRMIRATARHKPTEESDVNKFIDADLSIFGQDWETYCHYVNKVRREFHLLPSWPYRQGRKRFLKRMQKRNPFYITGSFRAKYEKQARKNIEKELSLK